MRITKAEFITSAATKAQFITSEKPIIAVCGKSNVGKSSFINKLAGRKKLAKVSKDPGRTRLVNYFDFGEFILADLPGYGYAKVSKTEKLKWAKMLADFFADKDNIAHVFCLTDVRHDPTADDIDMTKFLYYHLIPFTVIATKSDKLSKLQLQKSITNTANIYRCGKDNIFATSSETGFGFDRVLEKMDEIISAHYAEDEEDEVSEQGEQQLEDDKGEQDTKEQATNQDKEEQNG